MNRPIACCLLATLCILVPATVSATPEIGQKSNGWNLVEERGLVTYEKCWDAFKAQCGRNIVDDGLASGEAPSDQRVKDWTETMARWLNPPVPEPIAAVSPDVVASAPASTTVVTGSASPYVDPSCESGGDPQVYDPSGTYWGKYQYDQASWVADGGDPSAYGSADEAAQDAVAANATIDRWPNC
jgi:hypothetical protein